MIITKEMFDEFVESAENHSILWTDTLKLIGVTVGDVPDVDVIEAQADTIARLRHTLQRMIDTSDWACDPAWVKRIARAALAQETQP
jgi:hypothetical protein